mmetsp:Transcript_75973/g.111227  ORF Transcript_75973/g.111227 Transcript_75973/m.111227 type:complete len:222 (-) Transcript_75973:391-1056(-)
MFGGVHCLLTPEEREFASGSLLQLEVAQLVGSHRIVPLVELGNANNRPALITHVEFHHVLTEKDITHEQTLHAVGRRLHARLVCLRQEPGVVGDLKSTATNGDPERGVLIPELGEIIKGVVLQLAAHVITRDHQARGAGVHYSREVLAASGVSKLEQLRMVVLAGVAVRERGDTHDEICGGQRGRVEHQVCHCRGIISAQLQLGSRVRGEERKLAGQLLRI